MFKHLIIYKFMGPVSGLADCLAKATFVPCGATQQKSVGFVPPRELHGALVEAIDNHHILAVMTETKKAPGQAVKRRSDELAEQVHQSTGRRPGKKLMKELKEQALLELLPNVIPSQSRTLVWLDPQANIAAIEAGSQRVADDVVTLLIKSAEGLQFSLINTEMSPSAAMAHWLGTGEAPRGFTVDRECELKSPDALKSVVRYSRHPLDTEEVRQHIQAGKYPTKVALTWRDRASFVLTDAMQVKKLDLLDVVFESKRNQQDAADYFDADVSIATGELREMIADLIDALGGEHVPDQGAVQ